MRMPWAQARMLAYALAKPLDPVVRPLGAALRAVLAEPLTAPIPQPLCDIAAMDGYAVAGFGPWRLVGRVLAGGVAAMSLRPGQAVEIGTGAAVPAGADAVLPYERAERTDGMVTGPRLDRPHIRRVGEDFAGGQVLLDAGTTVTGPVLGLAAGLGVDRLRVYRRPAVRVVVTGDELLFHGAPRPGRVRDAIGPMLPTLVSAAGGRIARTDHLGDDRRALSTALHGADVVVVCGATSVGAADHLRDVLGDLGADVAVDGVACRPGHPQLLAALPDGGFLVGLPGNPYAALVAALTLLHPLLRRLGGHECDPPITATLAGAPRPHAHDTLLLAVRLSGSIATPVGNDRPGSLWAPAAADALAVLPPDWHGEDVELLPLAR